MAVELADILAVRKPWGRIDLAPWSAIQDPGFALGELWFQRASPSAPAASLLFKMLFTTQPLSIQVHPDDTFARSIGLAGGKSEAWYILAAEPGAQIAIGLKRPLSPSQLRSAIEDGSISQLVDWRPVATNDVFSVPAGTIHAIGAGLVIAEIQQHSDATFRLFDYGRDREIHLDNAVAATTAEPSGCQPHSKYLTDARTLLMANPYFVMERIEFLPNSIWELCATRETWMLVLAGRAKVGLIGARGGEAIFVEADRVTIEAGPDGMAGLLAYVGPDPSFGILRDLNDQDTTVPVGSCLQSVCATEVVS